MKVDDYETAMRWRLLDAGFDFERPAPTPTSPFIDWLCRLSSDS